MSASAAHSAVRTARALFRGPCPRRRRRWSPGSCRLPMPRRSSMAPTTSPPTSRPRRGRCWWRRPAVSTRPSCGGWLGIWSRSPTRRRHHQAERCHTRRGCGCRRPSMAWSRLMGCWSPRPAPSCRLPWSRWPTPLTPTTPARGARAPLTPWPSWRGGPWRVGGCPGLVGSGPAAGHRRPRQPPGPSGGGGGDLGWVGRWTRRPAGGWPGTERSPGCWSAAGPATTPIPIMSRHRPWRWRRPRACRRPRPERIGSAPGLAAGRGGQAAPGPGWGALPALEVGRATRVVHPAQRAALAVRDQGCVFPGCERPLGWCDAHHLWHWVDGGPTDLANLALLCRAPPPGGA
jgi:hypothetical protein